VRQDRTENKKNMSDFELIVRSSSLSDEEVAAALHYRSTLGEKGRASFQASLLDVLGELHSKAKVIESHLDTMEFLSSIPFCKENPYQPLIIRSSCLIQLHEAVLQWRKLLTAPLPLIRNNRLALVEILRSCVDIDKAVQRMSTSVRTPKSSSNPTSFGKRSKFNSAAKEMLKTSGYFPFAVSMDEGVSKDAEMDTLSMLVPRVQAALRYFRGEHDRQICLAERRVHFLSQGKWQPILHALFKYIGFQNCADLATEQAKATATLRTISRLYSDEDKAELQLYYEGIIPPKIDLHKAIGSQRRVPEYVSILERCDPCTQLDIATTFATLSRTFETWLGWTYRRGWKRDAEELLVIVEMYHMKKRLGDWSRWVAQSRESKLPAKSVGPVVRIRRKIGSGGADKEATPLADAVLSDPHAVGNLFPAAPVIHDSEIQTQSTKKRGLFIKFHR
jgi:hypothetical protein